ncbi:hypothetical protein OHA40_08000 [Nocardia sp. NBC_00508]|uniref:hypothetical protein n=1 Tax=Nocardia sp. NBC_00508 TaxID=2975992 RepID=UPI002E81BE98|nr:hypothetical protein [Nocardia sp. NBC_00508]WUD68050.1 hypothetical protein OHA40_08000 [Nocardia sp. NBC_00508]
MSKATRVTVTLDPQVAEWAREAADRQSRSLSSVINAALRSTLVHDSLSALIIDEEAEQAAAYDDLALTQAAEDDASGAA